MNEAPRSSPVTSPRRTAIIAVHGVGSPPREQTAFAVSELLVQFPPLDPESELPSAHYTGFVKEDLTIPVTPVVVADAPDRSSRSRMRRVGAWFAQAWQNDRTEFTMDSEPVEAPSTQEPTADLKFMREQLRGYESRREPYHTVRFQGERVSPAGSRGVDVYEMHWADLSQVGTGIRKVLWQIYQLILHLSHIGRKTLDVGEEEVKQDAGPKLRNAWTRYAGAHASAVRIFTLLIPIASIQMLTWLAWFIPAGVTEGRRLIVGVVTAAVILVCALGWSLFFRSAIQKAGGLYIAGLILVGAGAWALYRWPPFGAVPIGTFLLIVVTGALALALYGKIVSAYDSGRPGAIAWGWTSLGVVALVALVRPGFASPGDVAESARHYAMGALQWSYLILMLCWVLLYAFVVQAAFWRRKVRKLTGDEHEVDRLKRAAWTARVTLAGSMGFFIITALIGYTTLLGLAVRYQTKLDLFPVGDLQPVVPFLFEEATLKAPDLFEHMILDSGTSGLPFVLLGVVGSLLAVSWLIVLIAGTSIKVPDPAWKHGEQLGYWITDGFTWVRRAGTFFAICLFGFFTIGAAMDLVRPFVSLPPRVDAWFHQGATQFVLNKLAYLLLASAVTIAAVRGRVAVLATKARPALGIMLDVDNYLRESPYEATPRAQMAERYASLLRYVNELRGTDNSPLYDRVVIVSHSQGTVLSADLLRYLKANPSGVMIQPDRYRLLTMGSPLRQLYAANFPHLYRWVDYTDDVVDSGHEVRVRDLSPNPDRLDVGKWVNLYTTGDYVGRTLWRRASTPNVWMRESASEAPDQDGRRERCLGAGTHTKYWDMREVAEEIDYLVMNSKPPALVSAEQATLTQPALVHHRQLDTA